MPQRPVRRCGNCKWFDDEGATNPDPDSGACQRYPPPPRREVLMFLSADPIDSVTGDKIGPVTRTADRSGGIYNVAPDVAALYRCPWVGLNNWCGEWAAASVDDWEDIPEGDPGSETQRRWDAERDAVLTEWRQQKAPAPKGA